MEIGGLRHGAKKIIAFSEFIKDKEKSRITVINKPNTIENKISPQKAYLTNAKSPKQK